MWFSFLLSGSYFAVTLAMALNLAVTLIGYRRSDYGQHKWKWCLTAVIGGIMFSVIDWLAVALGLWGGHGE